MRQESTRTIEACLNESSSSIKSSSEISEGQAKLSEDLISKFNELSPEAKAKILEGLEFGKWAGSLQITKISIMEHLEHKGKIKSCA